MVRFLTFAPSRQASLRRIVSRPRLLGMVSMWNDMGGFPAQ